MIRLRFRVLILALFAALPLLAMGQLSAPAAKPEAVSAAAPALPVPPSINYETEGWNDPAKQYLYPRTFFVDPYQFQEVVRPKLPVSEKENLDGTEVFRAVRQWMVQLGVDMNRTNAKSMFWHDDGRLFVHASSADLDIIEAAITRMGKEYSGTPYPRLEIRVIHFAADALEENLRKLGLLSSDAATNSPTDVRAALVRRFGELGLDLANPKTFHYDRSRGCLVLCATHADLEIAEPEVARLQVAAAQKGVDH
jgi:hypothetical protein